MAKVKSFVIEDEVVFLDDLKVEFVSLVGHAANRQPFQVIKGDKDMKKIIHSVLVPKEMDEDKVKELSKEHSFSVDEKQDDALEGFYVYKQAEDEEIDVDTKSVAIVSEEEGVYGIVADPVDKRKGTKKEMDFATMDSVADSLFAMADVVMGTLRQPEATDANRRKTVLQAIDNFRKHAEAVLSNTKSEDVVSEEYQVKGENLEALFYHVEEEVSKEEIDEKVSEAIKNLKSELEVQNAEKFQTKFDELAQKFEDFKAEYETSKKEFNDSLNEKLEEFSVKENVDKELSEIKESLESLKTETKSRKSEVDDPEPSTKISKLHSNKKYVTFA